MDEDTLVDEPEQEACELSWLAASWLAASAQEPRQQCQECVGVSAKPGYGDG